MKRGRLLSLILAVSVIPIFAFAQTGKISGQIRVANSGSPLPGANVIISGTTLGAVTDPDGYYTILNVPPGTFTLNASLVGYTKVTLANVRVNINQTTKIDFDLKEEAIQAGEVTVVATRPIIEPDVSANVANVQAREIENIPVAGVSEFIDLQSGIEPGLRIRGSGLDQTSYLVDGITTRNARDNNPFTNISYTGIEELQVQTGGFNAEYGNVRSGLINVVTKEGSPDRYNLDLFIRYSPADEKYFGEVPWLIEDTGTGYTVIRGDKENNYFMRPYFDPAVAINGPNGVWDKYTIESYTPFNGWQSLVAGHPNNNDTDPTNDVTAQILQQIFAFEARKDNRVTEPDYQIDGTLSGPVPLISKQLGGLRFALSHRRTQTAYLIPRQFYLEPRDAYQDHVTQFKLTSDIAAGKMKLQLTGLIGNDYAINGEGNEGSFPEIMRGTLPRYPWEQSDTFMAWNQGVTSSSQEPWFDTNGWVPLDITHRIFGLNFTHTLNTKTFYEVRLSRSSTKYETPVEPENPRIPIRQIGPIWVDDAPFGQRGLTDPGPSRSGNGWWMGGILGSQRDSSEVRAIQLNFDITSQVNRWAQFKGGVETIFNDFEVRHGFYDQVFPQNGNPKGGYKATPIQAAAYIQSKLEFQGMIANVGVRLDHYNPSTDWYTLEAYDPALTNKSGYKNLGESTAPLAPKSTTTFSPRLGISFPITHINKLYFNFGHFRQFLSSEDLFVVQGLDFGRTALLGNPSHPFPTTIAYELGYDHNLGDQYLLRIAGYYKDLSNQPQRVNFIGYDDTDINYFQTLPLNYGDNRGFEITLNKNAGRWFRGFVNYTYLQTKSGNFSFDTFYQNRRRQNENVLTDQDHYVTSPVAEPFARANLEFLTPPDKGALLGDWRIDLLADWRAGQHFTWSGLGAVAALNNNVQFKDYWNLDLRISKNLKVIGLSNAQLFLDVSNVLNTKRLYKQYGARGNQDWERYMQSLHLTKDTFKGKDGVERSVGYLNIPGNDRPGDYRDDDVAWVPIETVPLQTDLPKDGPGFLEPGRRVLFWAADTKQYHEWVNNAWQVADQGFVKQVLDTKAYINMPNFGSLNFLNPRAVQFGIRLSF